MRAAFPLLFLSAVLASGPAAQTSDHAGWFKFYLPWDDSSRNVTDLSSTVDAPAGKHGFIEVKDARFRFLGNGERARFTGFVSVAEANFPTAADAPRIAARLARFGINILRVHLADVENQYGLFRNSSLSTRELDPARLDRMDYFFKCLKEHGIYVNLGLHVGRVFVAGDSLPAPITNAQSKYATLFHPRLIALQKEYARTLFTHVNPYTGMAYKDDPFIAFTELTNENSLFLGWLSWGSPQFAAGGAAGAMHPYYGAYLDSLYLSWLKGKYPDDAALAAAWGGPATAAANLIRNPSFENGLNPGWTAWASAADGASLEAGADTGVAASGKASFRIKVLTIGKEAWQAQASCLGLSVEKGKSYALTFQLRASAPAPFAVGFLKEAAWTWYGDTPLKADTAWSGYKVFLNATETLKDSLRFNLNLGTTAGITYWLDSVDFRETSGDGLLAGESLAGPVKRLEKTDLGGFSAARAADQAEFYYGVEGAYIADMTAYLKDTLGIKVPLAFTNNYFGLASIASQSRADYIDAHSYWDHPSFPNGWSATNYTIRNQPMAKSPATSTILELALSRVAGKPLVVSEYNHPFPNSYLCEAPGFFFGYLGFFDADAAYWHAYIDYTPHYRQTIQENFFSIGTNPVTMTQMLLGKAFRAGDVTAAGDPTPVEFTFGETLAAAKRFGDAKTLNTADGMSPLYPMHHPIAYQGFRAQATTTTASWPKFTDKVVSSTGELDWDGAQGLLKVKTAKWQGLAGFAGGAEHVFANFALRGLKTTGNRDFAAVHLVSLDSLPITGSKRLVLLTSGRAENAGTTWNAAATALTAVGTDTVLCEPVTGAIGFSPTEPGSFAVYPLDTRGNRRDPLPLRDDGERVWADLPGNTLWYEVDLGGGSLGVRRDGRAGGARSKAWVGRPMSGEGRLRIPYAIPAGWGRAEIRVELYSPAGKLLQVRSGRFQPGEGVAQWTVGRPASLCMVRVRVSAAEGNARSVFRFMTAM